MLACKAVASWDFLTVNEIALGKDTGSGVAQWLMLGQRGKTVELIPALKR